MTEDAAGDGLSIEQIEGGFRVTGLIDLSTVDRFRQAAAGAVVPGADLIVDLSGCTFMGSEGIGIVIETVKALGSSELILRSPPGIITKVLELSGLEKFPNVRVATG